MWHNNRGQISVVCKWLGRRLIYRAEWISVIIEKSG